MWKVIFKDNSWIIGKPRFLHPWHLFVAEGSTPELQGLNGYEVFIPEGSEKLWINLDKRIKLDD